MDRLGEVSYGEQTYTVIDSHHSRYVLKSDIAIGLALGMPVHERDQELSFDWAASLPDSRVFGIWLDVLYHGQPVLREELLVVDGARCYLPVPKEVGGNQVKTPAVTRARLANALSGGRPEEFARYFEQVGYEEVLY